MIKIKVGIITLSPGSCWKGLNEIILTEHFMKQLAHNRHLERVIIKPET